jgi:hypothetical protein
MTRFSILKLRRYGWRLEFVKQQLTLRQPLLKVPKCEFFFYLP